MYGGSRYGEDDWYVVTVGYGALGNVCVVVGIIISEDDVWGGCGVVCIERGEIGADVVDDASLYEFINLFAFYVVLSVSQCSVVCVEVRYHVYWYVSSEQFHEVWGWDVLSGWGLVECCYYYWASVCLNFYR